LRLLDRGSLRLAKGERLAVDLDAIVGVEREAQDLLDDGVRNDRVLCALVLELALEGDVVREFGLGVLMVRGPARVRDDGVRSCGGARMVCERSRATLPW
jgi:hypothetical protein